MILILFTLSVYATLGAQKITYLKPQCNFNNAAKQTISTDKENTFSFTVDWAGYRITSEVSSDLECTEGEKGSWMAVNCDSERIRLNYTTGMVGSVIVGENVFQVNETYTLTVKFSQNEKELTTCHLTVTV
jgi:hypothetical protein